MKSSCWVLTEIRGERQYGGNEGYTDLPALTYAYDSHVANHKNLKPGDVVIFRDRDAATGASVISSIQERNGTKELNRCPRCRKTGIKQRKTVKPVWRCSGCHHEFDEPNTETVQVKLFEAQYGDSYVELPGGPSAGTLKSSALRPSDQLSIEEINPYRIDWSEYSGGDAVGQLLNLYSHRNYKVDENFPDEAHDPEGTDVGDQNAESDERRKRALRQIAERRGQPKFRKKLLKKYKTMCAISGCRIVDALEAAHIAPYRSEADNSSSNGILLRADLHTLFDLDLIGIHPESYRVSINPQLSGSEYEEFDGMRLNEFQGGLSEISLKLRWDQYQLRLS